MYGAAMTSSDPTRPVGRVCHVSACCVYKRDLAFSSAPSRRSYPADLPAPFLAPHSLSIPRSLSGYRWGRVKAAGRPPIDSKRRRHHIGRLRGGTRWRRRR